ncbi:unnamed protein product, partial [Iphiclides podalirius]
MGNRKRGDRGWGGVGCASGSDRGGQVRAAIDTIKLITSRASQPMHLVSCALHTWCVGVRAALIYHNGSRFREAFGGEAGRFPDENKQKIIIIKMKSGRSERSAANGGPPGSRTSRPHTYAPGTQDTDANAFHQT